ncbi:hypothetical protein [Carboxylicivirga linearis]|uniref:Uncharacterized protein n=1 Tax=Carboxylicivirga linearis TaxID=1628157 RepID=A0ABS5JV80_9BACT|nr:hypothetical protein [Carboxylicivirga linearis]MBS2098705.1 hypothetical protein [Carboxylicivirga linearis]
MKKLTFLFWLIVFFGNLTAQETLRYINVLNPVIEIAAPSKDGNSFYHFYYSFNWSSDSSLYASSLNPRIEELEFYNFGAENPFRKFDATTDSENQVEFKINSKDINSYDQVQYVVRWEISNQNGQRLSYKTQPRTLRMRFNTDIDLRVDVSSDGIYYLNDINKPRIKIKTTRDGIQVKRLKLLLQPREDATCVAEVNNDIIRVNSNVFTELEFNSLDNLKESKEYYLYGSFIDNDAKIEVSYPLPNNDNNKFKIHKKPIITIKPLIPEGKNIVIQGEFDFEKVFDATGAALEITASLQRGEYVYSKYKLVDLKNDRWRLTIPDNADIPFGTHDLLFTGVGKAGVPFQSVMFSFTKTPIKRKFIQLEVNDDTYEVKSEFSSAPKSKVYLVVDGVDIEMNKSASDPNQYSILFSLNDKTMQKISQSIKNQSDNKKTVLITTKVNGIEENSYLAKNAIVVDVNDLKGRNRSQIKEYLEEIGFEENLNALAKSISEELKKEDSDRDWDSNVWSSLIEWAPKAISLVLMLV